MSEMKLHRCAWGGHRGVRLGPPAGSRVGVALCVLLGALGGCGIDLFGPDTPTGWAVRTGRVTNQSGDPVPGARVFWSYPGWIVGDGPVLVPDSAVADASGAYRLETEHYCNSQLAALADGYEPVRSNLGYLACPDDQPGVVDIVLTKER